MGEHAAGHIEGQPAHPRPQGVDLSRPETISPRALDSAPDFDADMREFAALKLKQRRLKAQQEADKPRINQLEARLLEALADKGMRGVDLTGLGKVGIKSQLWAKIKREGDEPTDAERAAAAAALVDAGLGDYVNETFNLNQVSALFREWAKQKHDPPPQLVEAFDVEPKYTLEVYAAPQSTREEQ